ncbi:MAG: hypothetical protein ACLFP2_03140 [Candidatus Woesearchaeota archaeon]
MTQKDAPVFVRIDEYKDVLDVIELVKTKIKESKTTLARINELKNTEDAEIETWTNELDEVERKIEFIDRTLFEPEAF